jgi:hypothetical protein
VIVHHGGASPSVSVEKQVSKLKGDLLVLHRHWTPSAFLCARLLMMCRVLLRAGVERILGRRNGNWTRVWNRRRVWLGQRSIALDSPASDASGTDRDV